VFPLLGIALMRMHWEVMRLASVDRSDEGNDSVSTDDSGDGNDVDLISNIAADDESDYGIDSHDKSSSKWLVFGARGSLVNAPPELIRKRKGRPPKVDFLHGLGDALVLMRRNFKQT
jgi:hypothetical protein